MQPIDIPSGAILQRDKKSFAIVPRIPCGLMNLEMLKKITEVVENYHIPLVKITSGQRIALVGMPADQLNDIWHDLGMEAGKATELCLHYVQACPGNSVCTFGVQDSLAFGIELEDHFSGREFPAKLKIGVSGCPFSCTENFVRDIGIMGKKKGWTVTFGGSSTRSPRVGDVLAEDLDNDEVKTLLDKCLSYYSEHAKKKERSARFIARIGIETFKAAVLGD
ncbi:MAG: NAD(P)/FAD-dependent oxidoreductase [Desulfocapsaceae bacterium]|jgi:NAD(P)H-nitrite reductase large subunit|nr:NAD(P)/FAD-dependent oxidoreductase [Desulfocapsaceae bacterium]